ncbi:uncharacterized protein LOC142973573 isoform X3 [Anticarsia gemmatalis]|uniref:uncharacterized protein LOC142973573 isoform X3 n=1 Tax=Anticarsia gemmatalis TaxID=129554 RepID=UPI003F76B174
MLMTKKTLFLYFSLLFLTICRTNDYCSPDFCNNSRQHTLCKYRSEDPAGRCLSYERTILNTMDRQLILDKINNRRNKVAAGEIRSLPPAAGMMKMVWNAELENSAQRWADQCVKHDVPDLKDSCRDTIDMRVGQNIATVQGDSPGLSPLALVDVWYMELLKINSSVISRYVPSSETGAAHYDYFTQLVWEESTDVGCGGVKFKERLDIVNYRTIYRLVCNFAPAGNRRNQTVYSCGSPCSGCPDGVCDSDYRALCEQKPAKSEGAEKVPYYEETSMSLMSSQTIPFLQNTTNDIHTVTDVLYDAEVSSSDNNSEKDSTFDYFPHLYNPKHLREEITASTKDVIKEDDEGSSETPESYYDNTNLAQSDVEMEIENLKMSSVTKDFLDEIFESDTSTEREKAINIFSNNKIKHANSLTRMYLSEDTKRRRRDPLPTIAKTKSAECTHNSVKLPKIPKLILRSKNIDTKLQGKTQCYKELLRNLANDLRKLKLNDVFHCTRNTTAKLIFRSFLLFFGMLLIY